MKKLRKKKMAAVVDFTVTVKVRDFADDTVYFPGMRLDYLEHNPKTVRVSDFLFNVYPNGWNSSTSGTVSFHFFPMKYSALPDVMKDCHATIVACVLDSEGQRRLAQSFSQSCTPWTDFSSFYFVEYLPRSLLLKESTEFLHPDGTLVLQFEILLREWWFPRDSRIILSDYIGLEVRRDHRVPPGPGNFLDCESEFAKELGQESSVLGFILSMDTPDRWLHIPEEEYRRFQVIEMLFYSRIAPCPFFEKLSLEAITDLYKTADKYDIPFVSDVCRRWLRLCLRAENVREVAEFADSCEDDVLRGIVDEFSRRGAQEKVEDETWECVNPENKFSLYMFRRKWSSLTEEECDLVDRRDRYEFYS